MHPDKSKAENATEIFQVISKANEVLSNNETKALFDYYLDHPTHYFKVSGHHYLKALPHSDVWGVILVVLILFSVFVYIVQKQNYDKAIKYLEEATLKNVSLKLGGTKQTLQLNKQANELFDEEIKQMKTKKNGSIDKETKNQLFETIVKNLCSEAKLPGGLKKFEWTDLFIIKFVLFPVSLVKYFCKYHRRYISTTPLEYEEKVEMSIEIFGVMAWDSLPDDKQNELITKEIWKSEVYDDYILNKDKKTDKKTDKKSK
jgi:DnaJ family protein C protein 25